MGLKILQDGHLGRNEQQAADWMGVELRTRKIWGFITVYAWPRLSV